jgi:hypothetical protein
VGASRYRGTYWIGLPRKVDGVISNRWFARRRFAMPGVDQVRKYAWSPSTTTCTAVGTCPVALEGRNDDSALGSQMVEVSRVDDVSSCAPVRRRRGISPKFLSGAATNTEAAGRTSHHQSGERARSRTHCPATFFPLLPVQVSNWLLRIKGQWRLL